MTIEKGDTVRFLKDGNVEYGEVVGIYENQKPGMERILNVRPHTPRHAEGMPGGPSYGHNISESEVEKIRPIYLTDELIRAFARFEISYDHLMQGNSHAPVVFAKSYQLTEEDIFAALENRNLRRISADEFGRQWFIPLANAMVYTGAVSTFDWEGDVPEVWEHLFDFYDDGEDDTRFE